MVHAVSQPRNLSAKQSRSLKGMEPFCCTVLASSRTKHLQLIHTILICQFVTEGGKIDDNVVKRHPLSPLLFCSLAHPISLSHILTQVKKKKKVQRNPEQASTGNPVCARTMVISFSSFWLEEVLPSEGVACPWASSWVVPLEAPSPVLYLVTINK